MTHDGCDPLPQNQQLSNKNPKKNELSAENFPGL